MTNRTLAAAAKPAAAPLAADELEQLARLASYD
jgi:hypothetical protein